MKRSDRKYKDAVSVSKAKRAMTEDEKQAEITNLIVGGSAGPTVEEEAAKLTKEIPDWKDPDVEKQDKSLLTQYYQGQGYTQDQIDGLTREQIHDTRGALMHQVEREKLNRQVAQATAQAQAKNRGHAPSKQAVITELLKITGTV